MKKTTKLRARNIIGKQVRKARLAASPPMSQEDLAGRVAVHGVTLDRSAISRIEGGDRYVMDYEAEAIAKALKVRISVLFGGG